MRIVTGLTVVLLLIVSSFALAQEERSGFGRREMPENAKPLFGANLDEADFGEGDWELTATGELIPHVDNVIWTKNKYKNYICEIEFKLDKGTNSGFLIQCSDKGNWIPNTIEIQLLDDAGKEPNYHSCGSFYGYQAPTKNTTKPAGEWNKMRVAVMGRRIAIFLNGEMINRINTEEWTDRLKSPAGTDIEQKFQGQSLAEAPADGYIGIQGLHGKSGIIFRNLKIVALPDVLPPRGEGPRPDGQRGQRNR